MFSKILVAGRGQDAVRVLRACRELGVATVAVHSSEDSYSPALRYADECVCVGPAAAEDSYLCMENIIGAAQITGADAIHPCFGLLAGSAEFAQACVDTGIAFIGSNPASLEVVADKAQCLGLMRRFGVPVVPGSAGAVESLNEARIFAEKVGYPVLLKSVRGHGGRGQYLVEEPAGMESAYALATAECGEAFGCDSLFVERALSNPRHVEVTVLSDASGNRVVASDCQVMFRQDGNAVIVESPAPFVNEDIRRGCGIAALRMVRATEFTGICTVEFLVDENDRHYCIGMTAGPAANSLASETSCGVDIVKEQIRIAAGLPLSCAKRSIDPFFCSIALRIKAVNPDDALSPSFGTVSKFKVPMGLGVRVESAMDAGARVSPYYDNDVATLVAFGQDREEALVRAKRALPEFHVEGVHTSIPFLQRVLANAAYNKEGICPDFNESKMGDLL